jgi:opacity protein-like surface antigen
MKTKLHAAHCLTAATLLCTPLLHAEWGWMAGKVGAGYTQPVGGINARLKGGYNFNGGVGVNLGPYLTMMGEYTFMDSSLTDDFKARNSIPGGSVRVHAVTLSPVVRFGGDRRVSPYITGGFGWYRRTVELTQPTTQLTTIFDPFWGAFYPAEVPVNQVLASYAVNKGGWNAGAGLDFKFGDSRAKMFVEGRYHYVQTRSVATELVPITVGVRW